MTEYAGNELVVNVPWPVFAMSKTILGAEPKFNLSTASPWHLRMISVTSKVHLRNWLLVLPTNWPQSDTATKVSSPSNSSHVFVLGLEELIEKGSVS